ncbi:hypothetical protein ACFP47_09355 [Nesterenkonia lacusekhoensis]|uniref:Uncharacterized protein n=1 Tax=Nesterenkonia lacusekhoensis TaxID=150832 RepID=A0ABS4SYU9_9MICC|nr:hypothetical protein [Nesterenkonia lacusekhoensis]MBP2317376.1 hypothetical protein [Nesterenkonia lacusekhoensis]
MSTLEQLEAEAAELYPYPTEIDHLCRQVHVRARTVSIVQVEQAAAYDYNRHGQDCPTPWEDAPDYLRSRYRAYAREQFRAAGFYVEGEA